MGIYYKSVQYIYSKKGCCVMMKVEDMSRDDYNIRCKELELEGLKLGKQADETGKRLHQALENAIMSDEHGWDSSEFIKLIKDHHAVRKLLISSICEHQLLKNDFEMYDKIKLIQLLEELTSAPNQAKRDEIISEITCRMKEALRSDFN